MKVLLITDQHFGVRNDNQNFIDHYRKFYSEVVIPFVDANKIDTIINLGDTFDKRRSINFMSLDAAKEMWFDPLKERNVKMHMLVGNHDIYYKNTLAVNSMHELTKGMSRITVHNKPTEVSLDGKNTAVFLPWICADNEDETKTLIEKTRAPIAFGHLQIEGIEQHRGSIAIDGHSQSMFKAFHKVFSGHFHHRSTTGNITYLGNPYEITWSDFNDKRGFHIYDTETMEVEFVENPYSMFHKIYYSDDKKDYGDLSKYENCYVKIIIEKRQNSYMFEALMDKLLDAGVGHISVIDNMFDIEDLGDDIESMEDVEDTMSVIKNCVDGLQIPNKDKLNKLMQDLYGEALMVETV